jgi:phosphate transport system substrate-binding protein
MKAITRLLLFCMLVAFSVVASPEILTLSRVKGSDSLIHVARVWAEECEHNMRNVAISVGGGGSGTGFQAMLVGTTDLVNASRRIDTTEMESARKLGMKPVEHIVGLDALAVYLHKDNPLRSITFAQLSEIFGRDGKVKKWTDQGALVLCRPLLLVLEDELLDADAGARRTAGAAIFS